MSADLHRPAREVQALEEVGVTAVGRGAAWGIVLLFLLSIFGVALLEPFVEEVVGDHRQAFADFRQESLAALGSLGGERVQVVNRSLLGAMNRFEDRLEEKSAVRRWLLPRLQWRLASTIGLGNDQVYVGRGRWLFFRPDVDYVIGRGFLDPRVQTNRRRGGDAWLPAAEPDPIPALLDLQRQLQSRQIHLILLPTPVKPTVEPGRFSSRTTGADRPIQNLSFEAFLGRLADQGLDVLDPAPGMVQARLETGESQYLRTDTHWTPAAVEATARELAKRIEIVISTDAPALESFVRRPVVIEGLGDIVDMLLLPLEQRWIEPERVRAQMVMRDDGRVWRAEKDAEILLLGDSFTNVYSDAALGWGAGAGLGEQLSYFLQRPVDRLAVNAGGALHARESLQRVLAGGDDRLSGKRVLVYQFATRELAQGDWRRVELADFEPPNR